MVLSPEEPRPLPLRWDPELEAGQVSIRRTIGVLKHPIAEPSGPPKLKKEFDHGLPFTEAQHALDAVAVARRGQYLGLVGEVERHVVGECGIEDRCAESWVSGEGVDGEEDDG